MDSRHSLVVLTLLVAGGARCAETNTWIGANTPNGASAQTDLDNAAYWSLGRVPGVGNDDVARFYFENGVNEADLFLTAAQAFAPSAVVFNGCEGSYSYNADTDIYLDKSLTLDRIVCTSYGGSGGAGTLFGERLRIGTQGGGPVAVTLAGTGNTLDLSQKNATWHFVRMGTSATLDWTGGDIAFLNGQQRYGMANGSSDMVVGGTQLEDSSNTGNPTLRFSTPGSSVFLADQGVRGASVGPGYLNLAVRSDQTWTADPTAYVRFQSRVGNPGAGPDLIQSIDGGRLDNLGQVNILVNRSDNTGATKTTGQRIAGGTYGSLTLMGGNTSRRDVFFVQRGDVTLARTAVTPPASDTQPAVTNVYSLLLSSGDSNKQSNWVLDTDGYDLAMAGGLRLHDGSSTNVSPVSFVRLDALGSTVTIGGDVLIQSSNRGPWAPTNGFTVARSTGIRGNADSLFRFKGNFRSEMRSYQGTSFHLSAFEFVGGPDARTYEVGDAATLSGVQANSFSVAGFRVGDGVTAGNLRLVNDCLNDNPIVNGNESDIVGEKLVVGSLEIAADSVLDVNAQAVEVGTSLAVAPTGKLDLNTGTPLQAAQALIGFHGLGDQTTVWNAFATSVFDSDNPRATFGAVYDAGADRTYWKVASLGVETLVLIR